MNNKETLQSYNERLNNNNITLDDILNTINNLPEAGGEPNLQSKSITITENGTQNVTADEGYDGLSDVSVTANVPTGGDIPTKGFVVNEWSSSGYPTKITLVGFSGELPQSLFRNYDSSIKNMLTTALSEVIIPNNITKISAYCFAFCGELINVNIPDTVTMIDSYAFRNCTNLALTSLPSSLTTIGANAFQNCSKLALTELPSGLTSIGVYAFNNCSKLALKSLPDGVTTIGNYAFVSCTNLALTKLPKSLITIGNEAFLACTNLSLNELPNGLTTIGQFAFASASNIYIKTIPDTVTTLSSSSFYNVKTIKQISVNVSNLYGSSNSNGSRGVFENCYGMIACWVGSNINTLYRYTFKGCTKLQKLFIDLPRATVETFTNYQYAFMNDTSKTGIIVCNDDEGFMTKEEFDAIDWSTYTEEV